MGPSWAWPWSSVKTSSKLALFAHSLNTAALCLALALLCDLYGVLFEFRSQTSQGSVPIRLILCDLVMYMLLVNYHVLFEFPKKLALEARLPPPHFRPKHVCVKCPPRPLLWVDLPFPQLCDEEEREQNVSLKTNKM